MQLLSESQELTERLNLLARSYQMGLRVLANQDIVVQAEQHPGMKSAAWTDGVKITLNTSEITAVDASSVERMRGVNLHEMAHVLFSPRAGSSLIAWTIDNGYLRHFNVLEDQRIETLLTRRYPATAPWLTTAITRWVLQGGDPATGYAFVRGRKYLPGALRGALRACFGKQELLPRLDAIADEYRELVFPTDFQRAQQLIEEWADLMRDINSEPGSGDPNGHDDRPQGPITEGIPDGSSKQKQASMSPRDEEEEVAPPSSGQDSADDRDQDADTADDGQPSQSDADQYDDGADSGSDADHGDQGGQDDAAGDQEDGPADAGGVSAAGSSSRSDSESDAGTGTTSIQEPAKSGGGGASSSPGSAIQDLMDVAQQVLDDVLDRDDVQRDIQRTLKQVKSAGASDIIPRVTPNQWKMEPPKEEYVRLSKGLRKAIDRLVQRADPGWDRRVSSGRLNASRWYRDRDMDTAYDMWDEGVNDAFDLEVVIMVDESSSMQQAMSEVLNSMWIIKRALDKVNVSTTVITFSNVSRTLYHRKDKAEGQIRYVFANGGTDPSGGLAQAAHIFARSTKSQKILLVFTDGEWFSGYDPAGGGISGDQHIKRIRRAGVTTALGFIPTQSRSGYKEHGCEIHGVVTPENLVSFMSSIITSSIQSKLTGR